MRFRTKALAKRRQGEELDRLPAIAKPRGWLAALALSVLVVAILVGLFAGSIPRKTNADGVLGSDGGVAEVQSPVAGKVEEVLVEAGQVVTPDTPVATVRQPDGEVVTVVAGQDGEVTVVRTSSGRVLEPGTPVVTVARAPSDPTRAYLFLDPEQASGVAPGMHVDVHVDAAPAAAFGAIHGEVESVGQQPASPEELDLLLANGALAEQFAADGAPVLVTVQLEPADTPSGVSWTQGDGPAFPLSPGATVDADIQLGERSALDVVMGSG
jgi:multidrug efflux pump subunit AcrA (membrane-fusion protein)